MSELIKNQSTSTITSINADEQTKKPESRQNLKNNTENDVQFQIIVDFQPLLATSRRIGYVEL